MGRVLPLRPIGRSDLEVTPIGLGCWQFSKRRGMAGRFWPDLPDLQVREIVRASLEGGISWFDTAEVYGWGASERGLADALKAAGKRPGEVVVATKWWPAMRTARSITSSIDARLDCLGGFPIDLYQIHQPYSFSSVAAQMDAMAALVRDKKIRGVGVSNFSAARMRAAHAALTRHGLPLLSNQVKYSLLDRRIERDGTLAAAQQLGITIIAYSPLEQGILTGVFHADPGLVRARPGFRRYLPAFRRERILRSTPLIEALGEIGRRYSATPAQVALSWLLCAHGSTVVAIPGATKIHHAVEAAGAMSFSLEPAEVSRLDDLSRQYARI